MLVVGQALDQTSALLSELGDRVSVETASTLLEAQCIRERTPVDVVLIAPGLLQKLQSPHPD